MSRIIIALAFTSSVSALLPAKVSGRLRVRGVYSAIGRMPLPHQGAAAAVTTAPLASSSAQLSVRSRPPYMSIDPAALLQPAALFSALLLLAGLAAAVDLETAPSKSETGSSSMGKEVPTPPPSVEKVYPIPESSESAPPSPGPPPPSLAPKDTLPAYPGLVLPHETGARTDNINEAVNGVVVPFLYEVIIPSYPVGKLKSDLSSLDPSCILCCSVLYSVLYSVFCILFCILYSVFCSVFCSVLRVVFHCCYVVRTLHSP